MSDAPNDVRAGASPPRIRSEDAPAPIAPFEPAFAPLALWTGASFGLFVLATMGPRLWSTQAIDNASLAVPILAIGEGVLAMIAWPIWTRTAASTVGVLLSAPAWLLLAGRIALSPIESTTSQLWKLVAGLLVLAIIRLATPRTAVGFFWAAIAGVGLGGPVLWLLANGG